MVAQKHLFSYRGGKSAVWARHVVEGEFSRTFGLVYLFHNKTCTWKRGNGRQRKELRHGGVGI